MTEFDKFWNYSKPEESGKKFESLIPEIKNRGDKELYLQLLTQIARTKGLQMKFEEAHKVLDEVEKELKGEYKTAKIRYLLERGRVYNSSKQKEKARELFIEAFEFGKLTEKGDYTVDAAHMMAIIESSDEALKWNETAMKIAEDSDDENAKRWLGSLYNNTGWTYFDKKDFDKALEMFEKCKKWHEERNSGMQLFIANWSIAKTLRMMGQTDKSMVVQMELLKLMEEGKAEQDGYVYEELGEIYLTKGNKEESRKYFGKAYECLSKDIWMAENEKERLDRIKELSQ